MVDLRLSDLNYAVFDLETTGLEAEQGDEIIEIGAIKVNGTAVQEAETFHTLVNPRRDVPEEARKVHGISPEELTGAPMIEDVLLDFLQFMGNRILVAQNAKFDMSFIQKAVARTGAASLNNPVLDTMLLSRFLFSYEQRHNLDAIAARLNVRNEWARHRSLGDCWLTARILVEMIRTLERRGMGTLSAIESCVKKPEPIRSDPRAETLSLF